MSVWPTSWNTFSWRTALLPMLATLCRPSGGSTLISVTSFLCPVSISPTGSQFMLPGRLYPLPPQALLAIAGVAIFLAFLRTSEMVHLKFSQVHVSADGTIVLVLPSSKTSRDKPESISVQDHRIAMFLDWLKNSASTDQIWNGSVPQFRAFLNRFCEFLSLQDMNFSAYSIRRGGASSAFLRGISFDQLLVTGRWQSIKTARIYLDTGRAALIQQSFSPRSTLLLHHFSSICNQLRKRRLASTGSLSLLGLIAWAQPSQPTPLPPPLHWYLRSRA